MTELFFENLDRLYQHNWTFINPGWRDTEFRLYAKHHWLCYVMCDTGKMIFRKLKV